MKETSDAFPPLKSAAGAMCFILDNCEVWPVLGMLPDLGILPSFQNAMACHQKIESLTPRVQQLAKLLGGPVPKGENKEEERRNILGQ